MSRQRAIAIEEIPLDDEPVKGAGAREQHHDRSGTVDAEPLEALLRDVAGTVGGDETARRRVTGRDGAGYLEGLGAVARAATAMAPDSGIRAAGQAAAGGQPSTPLDRRLDRAVADEVIGSSEGSRGRYQGDRAGLAGVMQGLTLEHYDELAADMSGRPIEDIRRELGQAEEAAPLTAGVGRAGAGLLQGALIPGASGGGIPARIAASALQGAGLGAIAAHGASEEDDAMGRLAEMPGGALAGGVTGAVVGGGAEAVGGALRGAQRAGRQADRLRVASVATGTSRELQDTLMREAEAMPGGVSGLAERLRRLDIVPATGTAQDVFERASGQASRLGGHTGELGHIYDELDEAVPVPRSRLVDSLLETASDVERDPNSGRVGEAILRRAQDWEGRLPETMPYREARRALAGLGDQVTWMDPNSGAVPATARAGRQAYRGVRGAMDDLAEEALSPQAVDEFRRIRQDYQAADFAQDWSEKALARLARNRGIGMREMQAAAGSQSVREFLMRALGSRSLGLREGSIRASAAEAAGRVGARGDAPVRAMDPLTRSLSRLLGEEAAATTVDEPEDDSIESIPMDDEELEQ